MPIGHLAHVLYDVRDGGLDLFGPDLIDRLKHVGFPVGYQAEWIALERIRGFPSEHQRMDDLSHRYPTAAGYWTLQYCDAGIFLHVDGDERIHRRTFRP